MKVDPIRIKSYLSEIRRNSVALQELLDQNEIGPGSIPLKAAKYNPILDFDDQRLIFSIQSGRNDFDRFLVEIEAYMLKN